MNTGFFKVRGWGYNNFHISSIDWYDDKLAFKCHIICTLDIMSRTNEQLQTVLRTLTTHLILQIFNIRKGSVLL